MLLIVAFAANLGLLALSYAVSFAVEDSWKGPWPIIEELMWLGVSVLAVVGLLQIASVVEEKALPILSAVGWIVMALADLAATLFMHFTMNQEEGHRLDLPSELGTLVYDASTLLSLGSRAVLFFFFIKVTLSTRAWVTPLLAIAFLFALLRNGLTLVISHTHSGYELYSNPVFRYGTMFATIYGGVVSIVAAWAVMQTFKGISAAPPTAQQGLQPAIETAPASPQLDFVIGGILLVVGIALTLISMEAASNGGRYVVATGAIAVGLGRIIRGFIRLGRSSR